MSDFEQRQQSDYESRKQKAYIMRRSLMDFGMGLIYLALGGYFFFSEYFGSKLEFPPAPFNYFFGGLCIVYGLFRIYRGYKKNYTN